MRTTYRDAREKAGMSREHAALELGIGIKTLQNYESGATNCPPDLAIKMGDLYGDHRLTARYCRRECPIGRRYCYEVLDNVDLSPVATLTKFQEEEREADPVLGRLLHLVLNKHTRQDLPAQELTELEDDILELLDIEHTIETLKLEMWDFLDVADLTRRHNAKCKQKGYICGAKEKDRLQAAI